MEGPRSLPLPTPTPRGSPHTPFERKVLAVVQAIPRGTVLAYGEVALLAGRPGGARAVVRALHRLDEVPWWRVVRADRSLAPQMVSKQAPRLRAEGVRVEGRRVLTGRASPRKHSTRARGVVHSSGPAQAGCAQSSFRSSGS